MMIARTRAITAGPEQTCGSHSSAFATNITVHAPQQSKERQLPVLVAAHWLLLNRREQMPSYGSVHELNRVQHRDLLSRALKRSLQLQNA